MILQVLSDFSDVIQQHHVLVMLVLLGGAAFYKLVVYPFFISPLRKIPGPYLHRISSIPSLEAQRNFRWVSETHALHEKYGNVIVVSPNHVSFNGDPKYVNDIYSKNMPKTEYYKSFKFHGEVNMFCELDNDRHLELRKMVQNLYSKSNIMSARNSTRSMLVEKVKVLVDKVEQTLASASASTSTSSSTSSSSSSSTSVAKTVSDSLCDDSLDERDSQIQESGTGTGKGIEVHSLFASLAMDVVSAFELGSENGTNLLENTHDRSILLAYRLVVTMVFWTTQMPRFWSWAAGPKVIKAADDIEKFHLGLYEKVEKRDNKVGKYENICTLDTFRKNGLSKPKAYSNVSDNIIAGHDTTSTHLTYMCYELSRPKNHHFQEKLHSELRHAFGSSGDIYSSIIDDIELINDLPFLEALVLENLRVHASTRAAEPRKTDQPYNIKINGEDVVIPSGVGVSCQPYSMHRVSSIFQDPEEWNPERWLKHQTETDDQYTARLKEMNRYMMPFGKGIRMCLGSNLALAEIKLALANVYWRYQSRICSDWCPNISSDESRYIKTGAKFANRNDDVSMMTKRDTYVSGPFYDECWLSWGHV